ncbi:MAG: SWIM zinc finger family protein [Steroidobacteraceae bacterium]
MSCWTRRGSLIELLEGRLSERVMRVVTNRGDGLFPKPAELQMSCSCPDWATMCKHVAAAMYGVGARLDRQPELLFALRKIDHAELITQATDFEVIRKGSGRKTIADDALGSVFGIELDEPSAARRKPTAQSRSRKVKPGTARRRKE